MTNERRVFSKDNFCKLIENSLGSNQFRNYCLDGVDVLEDGNLSCAFFVSSVLVLAGYLPRISFTVVGVEAQLNGLLDVFESIQVTDIQPGDILFWNTSPQSQNHKHIGF